MIARLLTLCLLGALALPVHGNPLDGKQRILFLGDSITHGGDYIVLLETALRATFPEAEFINLGLPSEGCTGLSEPAHPFPRPNVHERLDRALAKTRPDLVFACYGMNDGIYYPFSKERFAKYQDGMGLLIEKVLKTGAPLILLTPPPFDPLPLRGKGNLLPADAEEFSWMKIYEHYDRDVIAPYGKWILDQEDRVAAVVDLHTPITAYVAEQRRKNPDFALSGDGVHLDHAGHRLIAETVHRDLFGSPLPDSPPAAIDLVARQQAIMHPAWLSHVGHKRPGVAAGLPLEEARAKAAALAE